VVVGLCRGGGVSGGERRVVERHGICGVHEVAGAGRTVIGGEHKGGVGVVSRICPGLALVVMGAGGLTFFSTVTAVSKMEVVRRGVRREVWCCRTACGLTVRWDADNSVAIEILVEQRFDGFKRGVRSRD